MVPIIKSQFRGIYHGVGMFFDKKLEILIPIIQITQNHVRGISI